VAILSFGCGFPVTIISPPYRRGITILLAILPLFVVEPGFDEQYYYRLTNSFLGNAYSLDSTCDKLVPLMAKSSNSAGQYWKFTRAGGCYRMSNVLLGPGYALPTGSHPPFMAIAGNASGQ